MGFIHWIKEKKLKYDCIEKKLIDKYGFISSNESDFFPAKKVLLTYVKLCELYIDSEFHSDNFSNFLYGRKNKLDEKIKDNYYNVENSKKTEYDYICLRPVFTSFIEEELAGVYLFEKDGMLFRGKFVKSEAVYLSDLKKSLKEYYEIKYILLLNQKYKFLSNEFVDDESWVKTDDLINKKNIYGCEFFKTSSFDNNKVMWIKQFQNNTSGSNLESLLSTNNMVVLDLETTGLDSEKNEILEIGLVTFSKGVNFFETGRYSFLRKSANLSKEITDLTKITEEELNEKGKEDHEIAGELRKIFETKPWLLVGYNLSFDMVFFHKYLKENGVFFRNSECIDVLTIYRDRYPFPHKLADAISKLNIKSAVNSHRALDDALATYEVLLKLSLEHDDIKHYYNVFSFIPKYPIKYNDCLDEIVFRPYFYKREHPVYLSNTTYNRAMVEYLSDIGEYNQLKSENDRKRGFYKAEYRNYEDIKKHRDSFKYEDY